MSREAIEVLQRAFASSLRLAFAAVLAAAICALVVSLLIPAGSAHELAHSDHQADDPAT